MLRSVDLFKRTQQQKSWFFLKINFFVLLSSTAIISKHLLLTTLTRTLRKWGSWSTKKRLKRISQTLNKKRGNIVIAIIHMLIIKFSIADNLIMNLWLVGRWSKPIGRVLFSCILSRKQKTRLKKEWSNIRYRNIQSFRTLL